jgi:hypothetical protein
MITMRLEFLFSLGQAAISVEQYLQYCRQQLEDFVP